MIPAEVVSYRFHTCIATLTAFLQDPRAFLYKCFGSARHFFQLLQLTGSARWHPDILDRRCHIWIATAKLLWAQRVALQHRRANTGR